MPGMAESDTQQLFNLAAQHHAQGNLREAEHRYRQVLSLQPSHLPALHNLARLTYQLDEKQVALSLTQQLISLAPNDANVWFTLGNMLRGLARRAEAIAAYRESIRLNPNFVEAYNNLGNVLLADGRLTEAIAALQQAAALRPDSREAHYNLAVALQESGPLDEALASCHRALQIDPALPDAHNLLGSIFSAKRSLEPAIGEFQQAIQLRPTFAEAHTNLAVALLDCGRFDESLIAGQRAVELNPNSPINQNNLGMILKESGQIQPAIDAFSQAISLAPSFAEPHYNLSMLLLLKGDFQRGWQEYEWRWKCRELLREPLNFSKPHWNGEPLQNRTLLLYAEQGLGDSIQFARYLPILAGRARKIVLVCQQQLARLLQSADPRCQIVLRDQPLPDFDFHCPLLGLPRVLGTAVETIPANVPYLSADAALVEAWRRKLALPVGLKVGLTWAGNPDFRWDQMRSLNLAQLAPLSAIQRVSFYSLQKGRPAEQMRDAAPGINLINLGPELADLAETAGVMSLMDLIITTDTSTAHLAGALGRPVWVMLQSLPDWRWMLEREDSPWYPTMRLFRQTSPRDWDGVIARVAAELAHLASA
jgi:tetratricopeptide (TPR) repeat protein